MPQGAVVTSGTRWTAAMRGHPALSRRSWGRGLVLAVLLGLSWVRMGHGASGDLDSTFGTGGIAITFGPSDRANALIQQPDGKLVVAGNSSGDGVNHVLLVRCHPNGSVDAAFGPGGKVTTTIGSGSGANALIQQPDGKLVVAGFSSSLTGGSPGVLLVRYLIDGRLDATFGVGGIVTTDFGGGARATALVQQSDGKLVVAGSSTITFNFDNTILARYHPDGSLDATFGVGGKVSVNLGSDGIASAVNETVSALLLQADGKLVVTGSWLTRVTPSTLFVARFQPDGNLDPSFGQGGLVTSYEGSGGHAPRSGGRAVIQQPDGRLVVAGFREVPSRMSAGTLLARFLPDGRMDPAFGTAGMVITDVGVPAFSTSDALIQQPDGKLVIVGHVAGGPIDMFLGRYLPDGRVDPAFGTGGIVITDVGGGKSPSALLQQPDGTLVVAGSFSTSNETDILLARYQALGCPIADPQPCIAQLEAFVADVYLAALVRTPNASEMASWVDVLTTEPTPDIVRGMLHVVFDGPEFRQRPVNPWQYVDALYQAMLGREPDQAELDWWVQAVLDRVNTALPAFLESPEFQRLVPDCQDQAAVTLLVGRLYQQVLRRVASVEERAWWTQDISTWCTLEEAVEVFFTSLEYLSMPRTLADHVTVIYRALSAREPDVGGLAWWVDDLAGQLTTLEDDVMASPEFEAHVYRLFP
jgi:uncharacterized delta-60 repeat protein